MSLAAAVDGLRAFYTDEVTRAGAEAPVPGFHERAGPSCLPCQLRSYKHVQPLGLLHPQQRVFRVTDDAAVPKVAKFVSQPYPEELHTRWAERGLVPPLTEGPESAIPRLHGLLQLVWMEALGPGDGWQLLADVASVSAEMEAALLAALTRLHEPLELAGEVRS